MLSGWAEVGEVSLFRAPRWQHHSWHSLPERLSACFYAPIEVFAAVYLVIPRDSFVVPDPGLIGHLNSAFADSTSQSFKAHGTH